MRVAFLSLDFGLLLLALFALLHTQGTTASKENVCPPNNSCVSSEKCEVPEGQSVCPNSGDVCCSSLKKEYKRNKRDVQCRDLGGICMKSCRQHEIRYSDDCTDDWCCLGKD